MNINDLNHDPNPIESIRTATRYEIDPEDQDRFELSETEWFDDDFGDLIRDIDDMDTEDLQ